MVDINLELHKEVLKEIIDLDMTVDWARESEEDKKKTYIKEKVCL